ncbi:hypothetical protein HRbin03_00118 [archaeon HR03]|nr:hypothetical protein HRbin03_00118 [archaeon HR03]
MNYPYEGLLGVAAGINLPNHVFICILVGEPYVGRCKCSTYSADGVWNKSNPDWFSCKQRQLLLNLCNMSMPLRFIRPHYVGSLRMMSAKRRLYPGLAAAHLDVDNNFLQINYPILNGGDKSNQRSG